MAEGQQDTTGRLFGWWPLRRKGGGRRDGSLSEPAASPQSPPSPGIPPAPGSRPSPEPPLAVTGRLREPAGQPASPPSAGRARPWGGPLWVSGGVEEQEVPGQLGPARPKLVWRSFEPVPLERAIRRAYRYLVDRWGSSREPLRVVRVPGVVWLAGMPPAGERPAGERPAGVRLAVVGAGEALVLARARNDRRYQLYHANLEQAASWSAGRLEVDALAPWTNPLRHLLYRWLQQGVELTGIDGVVVCTGHGGRMTAISAALACAVAGWRPPWIRAWDGEEASDANKPGQHGGRAAAVGPAAGSAALGAVVSAWPLEQAARTLPWPEPWGQHVAALRAAAAVLPHSPGAGLGAAPGELRPTINEHGVLVLVALLEDGEPTAVVDASRQLAVWAWPETLGDEPDAARQAPTASGVGDGAGPARPEQGPVASWRGLLEAVAGGDGQATRRALVTLAGGSATPWPVVVAYGDGRTPEGGDSLTPAPCGLLVPASENPPAGNTGPEPCSVTPWGSPWSACRILRGT